MRPISHTQLVEILEAVSFDEEALFRRRIALVDQLKIDEVTLLAKVGVLQAMRLCFDGARFDLDIEGIEREPAIMIGVLDAAERIVDLVAWPIDRPDKMATFAGHTAMLGEEQLLSHPTTIFSVPLKIHRTAVDWLRGGCAGIVPIDLRHAASSLRDAAGTLEAADDAHGDEILAAIEAVARPRIVVARHAREAA